MRNSRKTGWGGAKVRQPTRRQKRLSEPGLSKTQAKVLLVLKPRQGKTVEQVAELSGTTTGAAARSLMVLMKRDWVDRQKYIHSELLYTLTNKGYYEAESLKGS